MVPTLVFFKVIYDYLGLRLRLSHLIKFRLGQYLLMYIGLVIQYSTNISAVNEIHASTPHYELLYVWRPIE